MTLPSCDRLPAGVRKLRSSSLTKDAWLVECAHAPENLRRRDGYPGTMCSVCKGDDQTTSGYQRPVKYIVVITEADAPQETLF